MFLKYNRKRAHPSEGYQDLLMPVALSGGSLRPGGFTSAVAVAVPIAIAVAVTVTVAVAVPVPIAVAIPVPIPDSRSHSLITHCHYPVPTLITLITLICASSGLLSCYPSCPFRC